MDIASYIESRKKIQKILLEFIDCQEDIEEKYQNFVNIIEDNKIKQKSSELQIIISMIINISNNHHRSINFFSKIERILQFFKEDIIQNFDNSQIFTIFKKNKRLLLFLIENEIMKMDENVFTMIQANKKFEKNFYLYYFFKDIKLILKNKTLEKKIEKKLSQFKDQNKIEELRKCGENEEHICQLIREDKIEEFITYVGLNDLSLSKRIEPSIFETNSYLLNKEPSLIEYAAFFGSVQIFKYLFLNNEKLTFTLWLFAIHGQNPEIIRILEENKIEPQDKTYNECLFESIKCHHLDIIEYIKDNYLLNKSIEDYSKSFKYFNFSCFPDDLNNESSLFYACKYNYITLVELILKNKKLDINAKTIFSLIFSNKI